MAGIGTARHEEAGPDALFARIGAFLVEHRLSPEPGHYAFAYHVLVDESGPLAQAVNALADGGVRLSGADIEALGGEASSGAPLAIAPASSSEGLAVRAELQVAGFAAMVRSMHDETRGFGRDLAASAETIRLAPETPGGAELAQLTAGMLDRVRVAEQRLDAATAEANDLREQLAAAHGSARRDPLTDLPNRRAFEEAFAGRHSSDPGGPRCVAICDVDFFKQVNDGFGHAVGDRVLKAIGQALASSCDGHLVARHGGEEFAVLFDGLGEAAAHAVLDAARESLAARRFRLRESDTAIGAITVSAGVSAVAPGEPLDVALARADQALYRAKSNGRNRVFVSQDLPNLGADCG